MSTTSGPGTSRSRTARGDQESLIAIGLEAATNQDLEEAVRRLAAQQESQESCTVTGAVFDLSSFGIPPRGRG